MNRNHDKETTIDFNFGEKINIIALILIPTYAIVGNSSGAKIDFL